MATDTDQLEAAVEDVKSYCESRIPSDLRDEIRLEVARRGRAITIHEERTPWDPECMGPEWTKMAIARLRFDPSSRTWSLHCRDSSDRWWAYDGIGPADTVEPLLAEMDRDPTGVFWG